MRRLTDHFPLFLGSGSPRRREILESLRIPHRVVAPDADESVRARESPEDYLERIVIEKFACVRAKAAGRDEERAILVADTSVILDGDILGKPRDAGDAREIVARLSGRTHEVHTRFAVGAIGDALPGHAETVVTRVTFRALSEREVRAYAETCEGIDKAGAYAVQGLGAALVSRIDGSYTNVVGLPACELMVALQKLELLPV